MATTINITNSGSGAYLIDNVTNGTIQLVRGNTYNLVINATGHPFGFKQFQVGIIVIIYIVRVSQITVHKVVLLYL